MEFIHAFTQFDIESKKVTFFNLMMVGGAGALHFLPQHYTPAITAYMKRLPVPVLGVALGLVLAAFTTFSPEGVASFIYFRF